MKKLKELNQDNLNGVQIRRLVESEEGLITLGTNNSFASAELIDPNELIIGSITDPNKTDYYDIFFGNHSVGLVTIEPLSGFEIILYIYDENENKIGKYRGEAGNVVTARIPLKLGRRFYLEIMASPANFPGELELPARYSLKCVKMTNQVEETDSSNDDFYEAQRININDTVLGWIDNNGDWDMYKIVPNESGTIRVVVQPSDSTMRLRLYAYDRNENQIDYDVALTGYPAELEFDVVGGRTYYFEVDLYKTYKSGLQYTLYTEKVGLGGGEESEYNIANAILDVQIIENGIKRHTNFLTKREININAIAYLLEVFKYDGYTWMLTAPQLYPALRASLQGDWIVQEAVNRLKLGAKKVTDPSGNPIDFGHMIASIVGYYCPAGIGSLLPSEFFSWAGDLASGAGKLYELMKKEGHPKNYETAKSLAQISSSWQCGWADMNSDIDAELIGKKLKSNSALVLSDVMFEFFDQVYKNRYAEFVHTRGGESNLELSLLSVMSNDVVLNPGTPDEMGLRFLAYMSCKDIGALAMDSFYLEAMGWKFSEELKRRI